MRDEERLQIITAQLVLVRDNLFRGMSKSMQKLQARSINEVLELPNFTQSPQRPDWAQQLPGAELYDRAARYEYIRTLNPRKFAALYNEALMGVHQFDDLVDRYRDAEGRPE